MLQAKEKAMEPQDGEAVPTLIYPYEIAQKDVTKGS